MDFGEVVEIPPISVKGKSIVNVPIDRIISNPFQPRKQFNEEALQELAASIRNYGVLQPLLVVPLENEQFLLIAGERRLRASSIAQLEHVPVILGNYNNQEVAEIAMIENLQREDLHYIDEAEGYALLMREFSITQDALAKRVGKKQSTIANKLRLLNLNKDIRERLRECALTERHGRALLKLNETKEQIYALDTIVENDLNVKQTDIFIESLLSDPSFKTNQSEVIEEIKQGKRTRIIRDVRIFINSIKKVVDDIRSSGVKVKLHQEQDENEIVLTMRIPIKK